MNRKGFTLIELLMVVVIIGLLARIAIPKFVTSKNKAKLASIKVDVRNYMSAQEGYFATKATYATAAALAASPFNNRFTAGNVATKSSANAGGFSVTVTNSSITAGTKSCQVAVGTKAAVPADHGVIKCP